MSDLKKYFPYFFLTTFLLAGLAACGGDDESAVNTAAPNTSTGAKTGNVALLFTDAPSDEFAEINLSVSSIKLISEQGEVTLFSGEKTINLLDLENHSDLMTWSGDVPAGSYNKIRLQVTKVELVRKDEAGAIVEVVHPKVPGNGKLDLNPRTAFEVEAGANLMLQLDMDAKKSIHLVKTGQGGYLFRPVVFVDILRGEHDGKLVRLSGSLRNIHADARRFDLCHNRFKLRSALSVKKANKAYEQERTSEAEAESERTPPLERCIAVKLSNQAALFTAQGETTLFSDLQAGQEVTVIGRFTTSMNEDQRLAFTAHVVELGAPGSFTRLRGTALSIINAEDQFVLSMTGGQGFAMGTAINVALSPGAKLFSRKGEELAVSVVQAGTEITVEGVLVLSDTSPDLFKAVLLYVNKSEAVDKLSGSITQLPAESGVFTLRETTLGDRCIKLDNNTRLYLITTTSEGYISAALDSQGLSVGQQVDVYGRLSLTGCFEARTILAAAQ